MRRIPLNQQPPNIPSQGETQLRSKSIGIALLAIASLLLIWNAYNQKKGTIQLEISTSTDAQVFAFKEIGENNWILLPSLQNQIHSQTKQIVNYPIEGIPPTKLLLEIRPSHANSPSNEHLIINSIACRPTWYSGNLKPIRYQIQALSGIQVEPSSIHSKSILIEKETLTHQLILHFSSKDEKRLEGISKMGLLRLGLLILIANAMTFALVGTILRKRRKQ